MTASLKPNYMEKGKEIKIKKAPHRPSKYTEDKARLLNEFTDQMVRDGRLPVLERFAYEVNVDEDTITNWSKKHARFFRAVKRLKTIQSGIMQEGIYTNKGNVAGGIFLLKNNHGFKDDRGVDLTSKGEQISGVEYVIPKGSPRLQNAEKTDSVENSEKQED